MTQQTVRIEKHKSDPKKGSSGTKEQPGREQKFFFHSVPNTFTERPEVELCLEKKQSTPIEKQNQPPLPQSAGNRTPTDANNSSTPTQAGPPLHGIQPPTATPTDRRLHCLIHS